MGGAGSYGLTRRNPDNAGDSNTERDTGPQAPLRGGGDDQILSARLAEGRSGNLSRGSSEHKGPLDPLPDAAGISSAVCGYRRCSVSLAGRDPRARFCSRSHKEAEKKRLKRAEISAGKDIYWLCDDCGGMYLGTPPTCPAHTIHTASPMEGAP